MISRYDMDSPIRNSRVLETTRAVPIIRAAMKNGQISTRERIVRGNERIDVIAAQELGSGSLWWVIAATSNIGWWMQVPPGTVLKIPTNLDSVLGLL